MAKKVAVLFSGGKDSCLAFEKAVEEGYDVGFLLNIFPKNKDSFMFHKANNELLEEQAGQLDRPLLIMKSEGEKEKEVEDLKKLIKGVEEEIDGVVTGGIASSYQGKRIQKICEDLGLEFIAPVWHHSSEDIWEGLLERGFKVVITRISCDGLKKEWLNKVIDREAVRELMKLSEKHKFRLDFEGGEAETTVLDMPEFKKEIKISGSIESEGKYRHFFNIGDIEFKDKS